MAIILLWVRKLTEQFYTAIATVLCVCGMPVKPGAEKCAHGCMRQSGKQAWYYPCQK